MELSIELGRWALPHTALSPEIISFLIALESLESHHIVSSRRSEREPGREYLVNALWTRTTKNTE